MTEQPHNHICSECGTVWHHDPTTIPNTHDAHVQAHSCPQCGVQEYSYYGTEGLVPMFCNNGKRCVLLDGSAKLVKPHQPKAGTRQDGFDQFRKALEEFLSSMEMEEAA